MPNSYNKMIVNNIVQEIALQYPFHPLLILIVASAFRSLQLYNFVWRLQITEKNTRKIKK